MQLVTALDNFYLQQPENIKECFLALKQIILKQDDNITNEFKYGGSFFCYKKKMFCYLWTHKKFKQPYIGFVEGSHLQNKHLLTEKRKRIKILLLNPNKDLPIKEITHLVHQAINLYKKGIIKIGK